MLLVAAFLPQELVVFLKFEQAAFLLVLEMLEATLNLPPGVPYPLNILIELLHCVLEENKFGQESLLIYFCTLCLPNVLISMAYRLSVRDFPADYC